MFQKNRLIFQSTERAVPLQPVCFGSVEMVNTKLVFVVTPGAASVGLLGIITYQNQPLF